MYARDYYINPQGISYNKVCIQSTVDISVEGEF